MWEVDLVKTLRDKDSDSSRIRDSNSSRVKVWDTIGVETRIEDFGNSGKEHELFFSSKSNMSPWREGLAKQGSFSTNVTLIEI